MGNNTFLLKNLDDDKQAGGPVNGHFLKHFFTYYKFVHCSIVNIGVVCQSVKNKTPCPIAKGIGTVKMGLVIFLC